MAGMPASMALIRAMRNGCSPRLFGMVSKVDEKTLCTESAEMPALDWMHGPKGTDPDRTTDAWPNTLSAAEHEQIKLYAHADREEQQR